MGLFSRKNSSRLQANGNNHHNGDLPPLSSNGVKQFPSMQRGNSNPAQNANMPNITLPKAPDPNLDPAGYLRSIHAVRERSRLVMEKAKRNQLRHFTVDESKFEDTARFVVSIIKRDFDDYSTIPPHGRWQHFEVGGRPRVDQLMATWPSSVDAQERTRRLIDLFLVSVLLDAGAGTKWQYKSKESGKVYKRSEGLAVASLEMFKMGLFSGNPDQPFQVDSTGLKKLTKERVAKGLQVTEENPIDGLDGRTNLLIRLADALTEHAEIFGTETRPGNMLDYLISHPSTQIAAVPIVPLPTLWSTLMDGLSTIWPNTRTQIDGVPLGDAWPCASMPSHPTHPWESIVPFHKLTQWLTYSLMVPMQKLSNIHFAGTELMTGLPEYRNGGLLVDTGLLTLKEDDAKRGLNQYQMNATRQGQPNYEVVPLFTADDDVIVEWRALTVGFLDRLLVEVNLLLGLSDDNKLSLAQVLEAGTWKGGREIAEVSRPNTKEPPIMILSDGTVF